MTSRALILSALTELSKVKAPSLLLEDYIYFANKAVYLYINKRYSIYDTSALTMDDLRVLKSTAILEPTITTSYDTETDLLNPTSPLSVYQKSLASSNGAVYEVELPSDYYHILNCICIYKVNKNHLCYKAGSYKEFAATRLDSDKWSQIINDYYNKPEYKRPYYFLHNVNTSNGEYTNMYNPETGKGTDQGLYSINTYSGKKTYITNNGLEVELSIGPVNPPLKFIDPNVHSKIVKLFNMNTALKAVPNGHNTYKICTDNSTYLMYNIISEELSTLQAEEGNWKFVLVEYETPTNQFPRTILLDLLNNNNHFLTVDLVDKPAGSRHANASKVRCEIRYGQDNSIFELIGVKVDYLKAPQYITVTEEQMELVEDTSQILEWPDYVCLEIINELVHVLMENAADPRLQTHNLITLSIASPAQQLAAIAASSAQ